MAVEVVDQLRMKPITRIDARPVESRLRAKLLGATGHLARDQVLPNRRGASRCFGTLRTGIKLARVYGSQSIVKSCRFCETMILIF